MVEKGALLATGATAEIYAWGEEHVLKLYLPRYAKRYADYEASMTRTAHDLGLGAPALEAQVEIDGRHGIIIQRVHGIPMSDYWRERPFRRTLLVARQMAEIHTHIHAAAPEGDLPQQPVVLTERIECAPGISHATKTALLQHLRELPTGNRVCHGDFHLENVLVDGDKRVVIDWIDMTQGNPLADVARTYIVLSQAMAQFSLRNLIPGIFLRVFLSAYLRDYCRINRVQVAEIAAWFPVIAAARLNESSADPKLLNRWIERYLPHNH